MNGSNLFVDTNILIYLLNKEEALLSILDSKSISISFISELELLSFKNYSPSEKKKLDELLDDCIIVDINKDRKSVV